jgi:nucleotide-binding universal stress UspA family protein
MAEVKKILFALELVELSKEIVPWVELTVKKFNADLHILHVIPDLDYWGVAYAISPRHMDDEKALIGKAEQMVADFCMENLSEGLQPKIKILIGKPADEIISYINSDDMSIVVIGSHGRKGLHRALFGSVAERVLRFSPVPVIYVNPYPVGVK